MTRYEERRKNITSLVANLSGVLERKTSWRERYYAFLDVCTRYLRRLVSFLVEVSTLFSRAALWRVIFCLPL